MYAKSIEKFKGRNGDVKIKLYKIVKDELVPAVLVFHGGNFIDGSIEDCDSFCEFLCEKLQALVVSVDYRLAPKYKFPQGLFDCYDSINYICENSKKLGIDKNKIIVCGENAGGNIATSCAMIDKDLNLNYIKLQVLISPNVYLDDCDYKDYKFDMNLYNKRNKDKTWLSYIEEIKESREKSKKSYMGTDDFIGNQYASPLCAPSLKGLSDVLMVTYEDDYLRLQDESYCTKLKQSDVKFKNMICEGYNNSVIENIETSKQAFDICTDIAKEIENRFY